MISFASLPRPAERVRPGFVCTGLRLEQFGAELNRLYQIARELCPDDFISEETRELKAVYTHVSLGFIDQLRDALAARLQVPLDIFSRDRFSIHGCGPVGLHDDFFRFPYVYFVIVVAHSGELGLAAPAGRAHPHSAGDIILLDPRAKHALLPEGLTAEDYRYDSSHRPNADPARQFMFLDFDVRRPDLRALFRSAAKQ